MSRPIYVCAIIKADADEKLFERLVDTFRINVAAGHFTMAGCSCDPPCELGGQSDEETLDRVLGRVGDRLQKEFDDRAQTDQKGARNE